MQVGDLVQQKESIVEGAPKKMGIVLEEYAHGIEMPRFRSMVMVQWSGDYGQFWTPRGQLKLLAAANEVERE